MPKFITPPETVSFSSHSARVQYKLLMFLFGLAVNRYLYGIFCRGLAKVFDPENAAYLTLATGKPFKILLNDGYWTRFALYFENYEPEVAQILCASDGKTNVFCDLGANKGYWTVFASPLFTRVFAVEASSETFKDLSTNVKALTNVALSWAAVHEHSNQEMTFVNVHNSHASARIGSAQGASDTIETVETISVDDMLPPGTAALIKLDVEGAEIAAIKGARRSLDAGSVLIYEDHGNDRNSEHSAYLLALPEMQIYAISTDLEKLDTLSDVTALKTDRFTGYNFLAGRSDSALLKSIAEGFANSTRG